MLIDPIREFNPKDWTGKFYDDPQIVVTGLEATKKMWEYGAWSAVPEIIREIDISIRKRHKREELGLSCSEISHIYHEQAESYATDAQSLCSFQEGLEEMIWFCEEEYGVNVELHHDTSSRHFALIIKGKCQERVQKSRWILKLKEAELRKVQKRYERVELGLAFAQSFTQEWDAIEKQARKA